MRGAVLTERGDPAVTEIADQNVAAEGAEVERSPRDSPWRVEVAARGEAADQMPVRIEDINEAVARPRDVVVLIRVLQGIGHDEVAVDVPDSEWREAGRDIRIGEFAVERCRREVAVEHVDRAGVEIGGEKK